jgi:single-strand DNA-binding protein
MNRVVLTGRLTRDPESRKLASGKTVTQFSVATNDYRGGTEKSEYHQVVTWDRLAEICGQYLGKGQMVSVEGRLQTRQWEDDEKKRHWKTEIVASAVEMLSGKRKKDYAAESAAELLAHQAVTFGIDPTSNDFAENDATAAGFTSAEAEDEEDEAEESELVAA